MTPIERRAIDYSELGKGIAHLEKVIRDTRRTLDVLAKGEVAAGTVFSQDVAPARGHSSPGMDAPPDPLPEDVRVGENE
jgi:hypothetical protein